MSRPRAEDSLLNYFNEDEMRTALMNYHQSDNVQYLETIYKSAMFIINGMINKHFKYNSIITSHKSDAISCCILEMHKSLSQKRFDFSTDKRLFAYLNRIIKNTLLRFARANQKIDACEVTISQLNNKDNEVDDIDLMDIINNNNIDNIPSIRKNNGNIVYIDTNDSSMIEMNDCLNDYAALYSLFQNIIDSISDILSSDSNFNLFYDELNEEIFFDTANTRKHMSNLRLALKEIKTVFEVLNKWIYQKYGEKIDTYNLIHRVNPHITLSKTFKTYFKKVKKYIHIPKIFEHNVMNIILLIAAKENICGLLKYA